MKKATQQKCKLHSFVKMTERLWRFVTRKKLSVLSRMAMTALAILLQSFDTLTTFSKSRSSVASVYGVHSAMLANTSLKTSKSDISLTEEDIFLVHCSQYSWNWPHKFALYFCCCCFQSYNILVFERFNDKVLPATGSFSPLRPFVPPSTCCSLPPSGDNSLHKFFPRSMPPTLLPPFHFLNKFFPPSLPPACKQYLPEAERAYQDSMSTSYHQSRHWLDCEHSEFPPH